MAMGIIVLVFYPLFARLEVWIKGLSTRIVREGKSLAGKYLGLALAFIACLTILCYYYAKMWYHIDLLRIILRGEIGNYL
jgi:dolichol kinase